MSGTPEIITLCAEAAPTTVLTNGMLFSGRRLETLRSLRRGRVAIQISLDSPTPERHDRNRGPRAWERALKGIETARAEGFRVRLAATQTTLCCNRRSRGRRRIRNNDSRR